MPFSSTFPDLGKAMATIAGIALAGGLASCSSENVSLADRKGVPLAELDLSGAAPSKVILAGADIVYLREGDRLAIEIEGSDAMVAAMRFQRDDGTLAILRSKEAPEGETATVVVTMPAPSSLVLAGSGRIETAKLANEAKITIAGSGTVETKSLSVQRLDVTIAGAGDYRAAGAAEHLKLTIAGSGRARMGAMKTETAEVSIVGSGKGKFGSDGKVKATIMGSGKVTVVGRAKCEVTAIGSGKLVCEEAATPAGG